MKSLAILSQKGGVGKTSIAVNIAVYLASKGKNVCIIDNDFHGPSIHTFFRPNVTWINDFLLGDAKLENSLQDFSSNLNVTGKLFIGFADPSPTSIQKVLQMDKDTSIGMLRKYFQLKKELISDPYNIDYFIIDCSPGAVFSTINVMVATDSSLFIIKLSNADILGTSQMISALHEELKSRTLVLANFIPADFVENEEKTRETQGLVEKLFAKDIGDKVIEFLGWIPQDPTLLNYEFEQALRTIRGDKSSRAIFTLDQPEHVFSRKIIELVPILFDQPSIIESAVDKHNKIEVKQQKVFVVGEPQVGKTALYSAITSGRVPEKLQGTAGIDRYTVWEREVENIHYGVNWWDFAGQYAYRDTHKLFLTDDALYILVLNLRDSLAKNQALYWLQSIREKAPNAKILPVLTHQDEVGDKVLGLTSTDDKQKFEEYVATFNTLEPIKVSNTEGTNIDKVKTVIQTSLKENTGFHVPQFYHDLVEKIKEFEDEIFLSLEQLLSEIHSNFSPYPEYSKEKIVQIIKYLSQSGRLHILYPPSSPIVIILDVNRVTKVIALIIDQAKSTKGYIEEVDILDICADFFSNTNRRDAAKIIGDLIVNIDLALAIPERSSTGRVTSSWFIPHSSEVLDEEKSNKRHSAVFPHSMTDIGNTIACFTFLISTYDEMISSRLLGQLFHYIPYTHSSSIWRENLSSIDRLALIAVLYGEEKPIVLFRSELLPSGTISLKVLVNEELYEKGILAAILYALGKFNLSYEIKETTFIKSEKFVDRGENLLDRVNKLSNIPFEYLQTIQQAIKVYNSAPSSTIVTAVTVLEELFVSLYTEKIGAPHPQTRFWEMLKGLYEQNYIPRTVKIWADTVRLHRNNCAHSINPINANDVMIVLEEILFILEWYNELLKKP